MAATAGLQGSDGELRAAYRSGMGSYVKFLRGLSDKPIHEFFGRQADLLLSSATTIIEDV